MTTGDIICILDTSNVTGADINVMSDMAEHDLNENPNL